MVRVVSYLGPEGGSWVCQLEVTSRGQLTSLSTGLKKGLRAEVVADVKVRVESPRYVTEHRVHLKPSLRISQKRRWG